MTRPQTCAPKPARRCAAASSCSNERRSSRQPCSSGGRAVSTASLAASPKISGSTASAWADARILTGSRGRLSWNSCDHRSQNPGRSKPDGHIAAFRAGSLVAAKILVEKRAYRTLICHQEKSLHDHAVLPGFRPPDEQQEDAADAYRLRPRPRGGTRNRRGCPRTRSCRPLPSARGLLPDSGFPPRCLCRVTPVQCRAWTSRRLGSSLEHADQLAGGGDGDGDRPSAQPGGHGRVQLAGSGVHGAPPVHRAGGECQHRHLPHV